MKTCGIWNGETKNIFYDEVTTDVLEKAVKNSSTVVYHSQTNRAGLAFEGTHQHTGEGLPYVAVLPPLTPESLGDSNFLFIHQIKYPYVGGAMARGISSAQLVIELAKNGMLGFFGSAGMSLEMLSKQIDLITSELKPLNLSWGVNLIHTPTEPMRENQTVELLLQKGIKRVEASAFMKLSPAIVHYAVSGLTQDESGQIKRKHYVFAKISRPEVALHFLSPPPTEVLNKLVNEGKITEQEAMLGANLPLAEDITVESDSGGHTDNRPLGPLFSSISELCWEMKKKYRYQSHIRIGAAGGLGSPQSIASAFALGAAYVQLGSVHQSCVESGTDISVKKMLGGAGLADFSMTAAADMFEHGVKVQVLKRATMMPQRGNLLYTLYSKYNSIEELKPEELLTLERDFFKKSIDDIWQETKAFFLKTEPHQLERAEREPKHRMALIFRWYLGKTSQWPIQGVLERQFDYQIWSGPAIGAFNIWVKGTHLEKIENRFVKDVSLNLLEGACRITRAHQLRNCGLTVANECFVFKDLVQYVT